MHNGHLQLVAERSREPIDARLRLRAFAADREELVERVANRFVRRVVGENGDRLRGRVDAIEREFRVRRGVVAEALAAVAEDKRVSNLVRIIT